MTVIVKLELTQGSSPKPTPATVASVLTRIAATPGEKPKTPVKKRFTPPEHLMVRPFAGLDQLLAGTK